MSSIGKDIDWQRHALEQIQITHTPRVHCILGELSSRCRACLSIHPRDNHGNQAQIRCFKLICGPGPSDRFSDPLPSQPVMPGRLRQKRFSQKGRGKQQFSNAAARLASINLRFMFNMAHFLPFCLRPSSFYIEHHRSEACVCFWAEAIYHDWEQKLWPSLRQTTYNIFTNEVISQFDAIGRCIFISSSWPATRSKENGWRIRIRIPWLSVLLANVI
uniref:HDC10905 n=1 Tax=Drosophila melanogaster TaxID=7227 RepID=Q6IL06_DROME|nr:TPA_inf: HDC10905 [Drosophila melanogaster]